MHLQLRTPGTNELRTMPLLYTAHLGVGTQTVNFNGFGEKCDVLRVPAYR
jgi:hypothetical protein